MDPTPDLLTVQLRRALRTALARVPALPGVHGAPVLDGYAGAARAALDELGCADYELPASAGGLDLGLSAGVVVSEELGRAACGNPYRSGALFADASARAGQGADGLFNDESVQLDVRAGKRSVALAGFEALPVGSGVIATTHNDGWVLTGTATIDGPDPDLLIVATRIDGEAVLVALPAGTSGCTVQNTDAATASWPQIVRLEAAPVAREQIVGRLDDSLSGTLARARLRQAGYLLGIAEGALHVAVRYTGTRRQFDQRLRDLQAVGFPLARAVVTLRATRAAVYRGAWLVDANPDEQADTAPQAIAIQDAESAPAIALATAAEAVREVVRVAMQSCGVRSMTPELSLHRYFRLAAVESVRYGEPSALWRTVGAARLARTRSNS